MRASITAPAITRALREATWPARLLRSCGGERAKGRAGRRSRLDDLSPGPVLVSRLSLSPLSLIPSSVASYIDTTAIALQLSGSAVGSAHRGALTGGPRGCSLAHGSVACILITAPRGKPRCRAGFLVALTDIHTFASTLETLL
jgi:hypothetical protein